MNQLKALLVLLVLISPISAKPVTLLDTGTPDNTVMSGPVLINAGLHQDLAGLFSSSYSTVTVTSVQAYLDSPLDAINGSVTYSVTGIGPHGLPDTDNTLFSETLTISNGRRDWYGLTGLDLTLPPGGYWLMLTAEPGLESYMPRGAPAPTVTAFNEQYAGGWLLDLSNEGNPGFRVYGVIPEPGSLLLLGAGGAIAVRRRP